MQGLRCRLSTDSVCLELSPAVPLSIDAGESQEKRIKRLINENPVIIFSRTSCCMCLVMKRLLSTLGVHPTVIELDESEMDKALGAVAGGGSPPSPASSVPASPVVFIGGSLVGGLEGLMALHLSGRLVPKLREVGALWL